MVGGSHTLPLHSPEVHQYIQPGHNASGSVTTSPLVGRTTHLIFGSQPIHKHLHSRSERPSPEGDSDNESSSSDDSSSSRTLEIENISGLVKKLTLRGTEDDSQNTLDNNARFHGRSSAVALVEATRKFKMMHILETLESGRPSTPVSLTRRPEFWRTPRVSPHLLRLFCASLITPGH